MRIAIYSGSIPSPTFIENLILTLAKEGHEIILFGKKRESVSYPKNVKLSPTPGNSYLLVAFVFVKIIQLFFINQKKLLHTLKLTRRSGGGINKGIIKLGNLLPIVSQTLDVFHVQWGKTLSTYPELFELLDCPIILSLRGSHINYSPLTNPGLSKVYESLFPRISGFHAVSEKISYEAIKYGAEPDKIKVIYSGIDDSLLDREVRNYQSGQPLKIISIGRFHWIKGYNYALSACRLLLQENIDFHYQIIAQGEVPEEIIHQIHDLKLKGHVSLVNGLPHDQLMHRLAEADLFLLSSLEEGIANVVLEAMAIGVPVISTKCGGMDEVIQDEKNGLLVEVRSPESIAAAIRSFRSMSCTDRERLIKKGKLTIKEKFLLSRLGKEFTSFYEEIVQ